MEAEPLGDEVVEAIEKKEISMSEGKNLSKKL